MTPSTVLTFGDHFGHVFASPGLVDPEQSCGIGFLSVDGHEAAKLMDYLWTKYRIWTSPVVTAGEYQGVRITPNVYTTLGELDRFCNLMESIAVKGIPATD